MKSDHQKSRWRPWSAPLLATAAIAALAATAAATAGADDDRASHFPLEPGSEWKYQLTVTDDPGVEGEAPIERTTELLVKVREHEDRVGEQPCRVVEYKSAHVVQLLYFYVEDGMVYCPRRVQGQEALDFSPPLPVLPTELKPGESWEWRGKAGMFEGTSRLEVADAPKSITVPAGTFEALRVKIEFDGGDGVKRSGERWYVEGVGIVRDEGMIEVRGKKIVSHGELISYRVAAADAGGGAGGAGAGAAAADDRHPPFWQPSQPPVELTIRSPREGETLFTNRLEARFGLDNYWIEKPWQHIHVILDNEPYEAHYDIDGATVFDGLSDGTHTIRAFPARADPALHLSVKDPTAFKVVTFHVRSQTKEPLTLEGNKLLTYSRPKGIYSGQDAEKILLDFWVSGTTLARGGDHVRYRVDEGPWSYVYEWGNEVEPRFIEGLAPGKHAVTLELVDANGQLIPGPPGYESYNSTVRVIEVE